MGEVLMNEMPCAGTISLEIRRCGDAMLNHQIRKTHWKELPVEDQVLVDKAYEAVELAYAPYSNFQVDVFHIPATTPPQQPQSTL